jgi:hypothetical protein
MTREEQILASRNINRSEIKTFEGEGPLAYRWYATVGDYDLDCTIGCGATPEAAIEDLIDQLELPE